MLNRECQSLSLRVACLTLFLCVCTLLSACGHSTATFIAKGEEYLQKRKFHDALIQFRSAVESDKESSKAHWGMARAYENLGEFNDALEELRKTVELDETNLEAKTKFGNYFLLVQPPMIAEAEKLRDDILNRDANFVDAHVLTASIMAVQNRPENEIVKVLNNAIALDPTRTETYVSLARYYMQREKGPEAEAAIQKGIDANPNSAIAYTEYGRFLTYVSRDKEAEDQFLKAVSVDPNNIETREALADFYVTSRQIEKAEQAYLDLVKVQENSPESRLELAEFYSLVDRKQDAIVVLNQIVEAAPDYVRARYKLCEIYLDSRDIAKVTEQLETLLKTNDGDTEALMLRARLKMQQNRSAEAVKDLEEVLKKYPSGKDPLYLMAQARLSLGQIDQARAFMSDLERYHPTFLKAGLLKIQAAFFTGDNENAFKLSNELYEKALAANTSFDNSARSMQDLRVKALTSRGSANLNLGRIAQAKADMQEVVRLTPRSSGALVNLARIYTAERNRDGALESYQKALAIDPRNFDAISGIINTLVQANQTAAAHTRIEQFIAANAGMADVLAALHYLNSTVFTAEKNPAAAAQELTKSIELDEDYLPAYSAYASILVAQNRTEDAIAQYQKVNAKQPSASVHTLLGTLEESRGNTAVAEGHYRDALSLSPDSPIAANNLAWLIAQNQGNLDEALQLASGAVNKNQSVAAFYDTLGFVYLQKGLYLPAVEQMKKAVALDESSAQKNGTPVNPDFRTRLNKALSKTTEKATVSRNFEVGYGGRSN